MPQKILVTGASGFIGSHLTEQLTLSGYDVRVFIRYKSDHHITNLNYLDKHVKKNIDYHYGDIRDSDAISKALDGVSSVFHLAAIISVPYSYEHPEETISVNINGTLNLLQIARQYDLDHIVVTSTSEVYGSAQYLPIDEIHPRQSQSPYAASKIAADAIAESFVRTYNLPITIIRPFNTYGPHQSQRAIIPTIIVQALTQPYLKLGSLAPSRDFLYVKDTVRGFMSVLESQNAIGQDINLGTGSMITIENLAKQIITLIGKDLDVKTDDQRIRPKKSEVSRLQADINKAKNLLNWQPAIGLDQGLNLTINWLQEKVESYDADNYII